MNINKRLNSKIPSRVLALICCLVTSACALTRQKAPTKKQLYWTELSSKKEYAEEEAEYKRRFNGDSFCWDTGVDDFLSSTAKKPKKDCIYPASKVVISTSEPKVMRKDFNTLKVLQVVDGGFVVRSKYAGKYQNYPSEKVIFIHKSDESEVVDDIYLNPSQNDWHAYRYLGTYVYRSLGGAKTVYSFKKISREKLAAARNGFSHYNPLTDHLLRNGLWSNLPETYPVDKTQTNNAAK